MAGLPIVGHFGREEIHRDHFLSTTYAEWDGEPAYASAHFVQLPVSSSTKNDNAVISLPREIRSYENPVPTYKLDDLFQLPKRYIELYKTKLSKEIQREEQSKQKASTGQHKAVVQALRQVREEEKDRAKTEDTEKSRKVAEMQQVTQATEAECRRFLKRYDWDVKLSCEQYFGGAEVNS
ncbi:unnamed protein product [Amoebophrya sp. A25]|nr:unnamed protein product [Amoebophrya sp. A25]|eukprot:GSA25T00003915001.1